MNQEEKKYFIHESSFIDQNVEIGKGTKIRDGKDILFVTTGETAQRVLLASEILEKEEIFCSHINLHTIKPFDNDLFLNSLSKVKAIISVEEHSESGGLGEKCASLISQNNIQIPFKIIGFPPVEGSCKASSLIFFNFESSLISSFKV